MKDKIDEKKKIEEVERAPEKKKEERSLEKVEPEILPEIDWGEPEDPVKVTGDRVKGLITISQGKRFIKFKQCISERARVEHGFIGADEVRENKNLSIDRLIEIQLEKSAYIQAAAFVEWSNEEEISEDSILQDHKLYDLRELAIKYILKGSKMGN